MAGVAGDVWIDSYDSIRDRIRSITKSNSAAIVITVCIMTGDTVINDAGMIEASTNEAGGCMTDATILVSCYMAV